MSESLSKQTPNKSQSAVKYNYNSPVKSVRKNPPKNIRKDKKKTKLFAALPNGGSSEQINNIDYAAETDGVGPLDKILSSGGGSRTQNTPNFNSCNNHVQTPKETSGIVA